MNQTMLIADDSKMNREILQMLFHENYVIMEAENGQEALEVLKSCQGHVDVLLLDLIMPDVDGFHVLETCKARDEFKDVPIVVITASSDMQDQLKAFELGASDFISKPFIPEIVVSRVNNVMASYQRMLLVELEARKLKVKSELDQMTRLYNKVTTELYINDVLSAAGNHLHALLVIDIDNFKSVNDNSGHLAGDHTIRIIADLISGQFRKSDIVGRIGGDEFAVLMVDVSNMQAVCAKVNQLIQLMKYKPNLTIPENVTLSIGVASNEHHVSSYQELFAKADQALYEAKSAGKAQYREYGVQPVSVECDDRYAVILFSRDRGVCSTVHSLVTGDVRIQEATRMDALLCMTPEELKKVLFAYVDVSTEDGDGAAIWDALRGIPELKMEQIIAICRESDMGQYRAAMLAGVADILTAPLDAVGFKRRLERRLMQHQEGDAQS